MNDQEFVHDIKLALDQGIADLPGETRSRLYSARRLAMNANPVGHAGPGVLVMARRHIWLPLLLTAALLLALWQGMRPDAPVDNGDLDILMLTDDIPPQAFVDWRLVRREHVGALCLIAN